MPQLILARGIFHLAVASVDDSARIGYVQDLVLDWDKGAVKGFLVKKKFWSVKEFIDLADVLTIEKEGIVIQNKDKIFPVKEIVRVAEIMRKKINFFGLRVRSKTGKYLGKTADFSFDILSGMIMSIYTEKFLQKRIIPRERVVKITTKEIIVQEENGIVVGVAEKP